MFFKTKMLNSWIWMICYLFLGPKRKLISFENCFIWQFRYNILTEIWKKLRKHNYTLLKTSWSFGYLKMSLTSCGRNDVWHWFFVKVQSINFMRSLYWIPRASVRLIIRNLCVVALISFVKKFATCRSFTLTNNTRAHLGCPRCALKKYDRSPLFDQSLLWIWRKTNFFLSKNKRGIRSEASS